MVHDDTTMIVDRERITLHLVLVAHTEAQEAHNDVTGLDDHGIARNTNTVAWGCLTRDSQVATRDFQLALELDGTGYVEDDGTRTVHLHGFAQRTLDRQTGGLVAFVGERSDMHHNASASTRSILTATICARESEHRGGRFYGIRLGLTSRNTEQRKQQYDAVINTHSHSRVYRWKQRY